ncbi:MAG: DUF4340 domain-containing protein [Nitrosomonas sp.]|nr:DUF4340 domain-containing protein [Nitrosomonas sp.]
MTYHARINLIMLTTIVGLVVFLYIKPQSHQVQEYKISSLSAEAAQSIKILHHDSSILLKKQENIWHLIEPVFARADEKKVAQLLEVLSATSDRRFPLKDRDRFGLDKPNVQLHIDHEFFDFGGLSPVTNQQYVATDVGVFLISPRYAVRLPSQPTNIVSETLLAVSENPVSFELDDIIIKRENGEWVISPANIEQHLSQEEFIRWIELWQGASASNIIFDSELLENKNVTLADKEIKISLSNGQIIQFKIWQQGDKQFLIRNGEAVRYVFSGDVAKSLLDPYHHQ